MKKNMILYNVYSAIYLFTFLLCSVAIVSKTEANPQKNQSSISILFYNDGNSLPVQKIGGKALNLMILENIPEIAVPQWFCITVDIFNDYLKDNKIDVLIEQLEQLCKSTSSDKKLIAELASKIRNHILHGRLNSKAKHSIYEAYTKIEKQAGKDSRWAIRSSGVYEDLAESSLAGLYDSFLNQKSFKDIYWAIKKVWASSFNLRAIQERIRLQQKQTQCDIAVIVQEMIKPMVAGVATTIELSSNYQGIEIVANYGLGESVVGGEVDCDKWLVHEHRDYIIKQILGNKKRHAECIGNSTKMISTISKKQQAFSIDNPTILKLAHKVRNIKKYYKKDVDIEFAINNNGQIFFVQARPLVKTNMENLFVVDNQAAQKANIIAKGIYSVPTVKHGVLKLVKNWDSLVQENSLTQDTIILAYRAANTWSHYISNISGLITKEGSPTSHVMLLARERNIACLSGIGEEFDRLIHYEGKAVTLDGINRLVYEGKLPLKKASQADLMKPFEVVKVEPFPTLEFQLKYFQNSNMILFENGQYWLKTPQYPLKKFEQEINLKRFDLLFSLTGKKQLIPDETRVVDNYVYCLLLPFENMVNSFNFATIEEAERYLEREEQTINEYLKVTKNFVLNKQAWVKYAHLYAKLRAYNWLGAPFRAYLTRKIQQDAKGLELPQYYLEGAYSAIQTGLPEEDSKMQEDMHNFAKKIAHLQKCNNSEQFKASYPKLFNKLIELGKSYRFCNDVSIDKSLDLQPIYEKVITEADQIKRGSKLITQKGKVTEIYFPNNPILRKLIELSIRSRINQSNTHHYLTRGHWSVRKQLISLGKQLTKQGKLKSAEDIFDKSIQEITQFIPK